MALNESVAWRTELGGGTRVALVQAGTLPVRCRDAVRAGAARPVGQPRHRRDRPRAPAAPGAELPADRDAGRARARRDRDRRAGRRQDPGDAGLRGPAGRAGARGGRLRARHRRRRGDEPPPLRPRRRPAAHRWIAGLPARDDRRPEGRVGGRPRRQPAAGRLVRPARAPPRPRLGRGGLGRRRARAPARRHGRADRRPLGRATRR